MALSKGPQHYEGWDVPILITPEVRKESEDDVILKRDPEYAKILIKALSDISAKDTLLKQVGPFFDYKVVRRNDNSVGTTIMCKICSRKNLEELKEIYMSGTLEEKLKSYFDSTGFPLELGLDPTSSMKHYFLRVKIDTKYLTVEGTEKNIGSLLFRENEPPSCSHGMDTLKWFTSHDVQKIFRVHISRQPSKILKVKICSGNLPEINGKQLFLQKNTHLWELKLVVHPTSGFFQYWYEIETDSSLYIPLLKNKLLSNSKTSSTDIFDGDAKKSYHLDISAPSETMNITGYFAHCFHIIENVHAETVKESIAQMHELKKFAFHLAQSDELSVIRNISERMFREHLTNIHHFITFLSFLVQTTHQCMELEKALTQDIANTILKQCSKSQLDDIPVEDLNSYHQMILKIYVCADGKNANFLAFAHSVFPFVSVDFLNKVLQDVVFKRNMFIHALYEDKVSLPVILSELIQELLVRRGDKELVFLESFQRYLPMKPQILIVNEVSKLESDHETFEKTKKQCFEILHSFCQRELTKFAKAGDIKYVVEMFDEMFKSKVIKIEKIRSSAEKSIIESVYKANDSQLKEGKSKLQDLCLSGVLFEDCNLKKSLLKTIAKSRSIDVHYIFKLCLNENHFRDIPLDEISELVLEWFEHAVQYHCGNWIKSSFSESLSCLYSYVGDIISSELLVNQKDLAIKVKDIAFSALKNVEVGEIIKAIPAIEASGNMHIEEVFRIHLGTLLRNGLANNDICKKELFGLAAKNCVVNSRVSLEFLSICMEFTGLIKAMPVQDSFLSIIDCKLLWKHILRATGEKGQELLQTELAVKAQETILLTKEMIQEKSIEVGFFEKLKDKWEECISLFKVVSQSDSHMKTFYDSIQTNILDKQNTLKLLLEVYRQIEKFGSTEDQINQTVRICVKMFEEKQEILTAGKLKIRDLEKELGFDKILHESVEHSQYIIEVVKSKVFWNLCSEHLLEFSPESLPESELSDEDLMIGLSVLFEDFENIQNKVRDDTARHMSSGCALLKTLSVQGMKSYKDFWIPLLDGNDISMSMIIKVFQTSEVEEEMLIATNVCKCKMHWEVSTAMKKYIEFEKHSEKVQSMRGTVIAFGLEFASDKYFANAISEYEKLLHGNIEHLTLFKISSSLTLIENVTSGVNDDFHAVLQELSKASLLIDFLKTVLDDDIRNLIDAVEEHSEQYVRESTVSDLIDVKRFITPILKQKNDNNISVFFAVLKRSFKSCAVQNIDKKIYECSCNLHSLKALYGHVANRGERTKEMVDNVVQKGKFYFSLVENDCDVQVEYRQDKKTFSYPKHVLNDLRSRALLLLNTEEKQREKVLMSTPNKRENLQPFIDSIDIAMDICHTCVLLKRVGHLNYFKFERKVQGKIEMSHLLESLKSEYQEWYKTLTECRRKYYVMNFVFAHQMQLLFDFMKNGENEKAFSTLLKFIHPDTPWNEISNHTMRMTFNSENKKETLDILGESLYSMWRNMPPKTDSFFTFKGCSQKPTDIVQEGQLYVALLSEESHLVIRTLLALYCSTTGKIPRAYNILLCTRSTLPDDITLLINRCVGDQQKDLYVIANVETLSHENQCFLVECLRGRVIPNRLAVLFRGNEHHPFVEEFSEFVTHPKPLTENQLKTFFNDCFQHVLTITSDVPGLGKTETVHEIAFEHDLGVVTLHISGVFEKEKLVEHLASLNIQTYHILHIDISSVDNPSALDSFLFELIVLRYVSSEKLAFALETIHICIEISNSVNQMLCNSLPTVTCFKRMNLRWKDYTNMIISQELCSPVQVVCHYLKSLDEGEMDKKDIYLVGNKKETPLPEELCRKILRKHFSTCGDMSFSIVNIFLGVVADQLKKLSTSVFFRTSNMQHESIKTELVKALKNMSIDFSSRSINSCRSTQIESLNAIHPTKFRNLSTWTDAMIRRTEGMIRWEDSNHLIILFHQDLQTVSALFRNRDNIPKQITKLFESQLKKPLENLSGKKQHELQDILLKLVNFSSKMNIKEMNKLSQNYALTPDNLLKMILIILRTKGHQPIVIMGETGCGKTSLIRYLSNLCEIKLDVMNIHAGITEEMICEKVKKCNEEAMRKFHCARWIFLDEINTCDHLGLISDIVCHHRLKGTLLSPNLLIMAACNPYRLRSDKSIFTTGLKGKVKTDQLSKLVYRVHPLPEAVIDYVWDYGSLSEMDEKSYIERMVEGIFTDVNKQKILIEVLTMSQEFVRKTEGNDSCVSLRDVERCKKLIVWFKTILHRKGRKNNIYLPICGFEYRQIILSLGVCYHSRFSENEVRVAYRKKIASILNKHTVLSRFSEEDIEDVIVEEQDDILDRMELPPGTAKNTALRENVFVILVCILNRIPVFVVGKPGCSKSLSMQLIRSNLRGKDSSDEFFRTLPQLYCVSFQGSESSTSDGILKVFEKAQNYQKYDLENVMSVVILDEIGLAEISRFNPLKVLHTLLEPEHQICPDIAVVGISNWALDAAKMNRAIHLSRPEMDEIELYKTGQSICLSLRDQSEKQTQSTLPFLKKYSSHKALSVETKKLLKEISRSYFIYNKQQTFRHFHGLRDYYSLIKCISRGAPRQGKNKPTDEVILQGLRRNFGGLPAEMHETMMEAFQSCFEGPVHKNFEILDLIQDNIEDHNSRHLMLITSGDTVVSVLEDKIKEMNRQHVVIFGSQFEDDLTDDYNYRILSRIILCMEQGYILILKDLENIYGSLYDMLNQNYTVVGNKKNCRIALGPYSNPMCHVHDEFKCIVLIEESKLDRTDPPFLNRFEKQQFRFTYLMDSSMKYVKCRLEEMIKQFCETRKQKFTEDEVFAISGEDLISSLVLSSKKRHSMEEDSNELLLHCQKELLWITTPDAVFRLRNSLFWEQKAQTVNRMEKEFLELPIHDGLIHYLDTLDSRENDVESDETLKQTHTGYMIAVFTNSNIHTSLTYGERRVQDEKLGHIKSEKQLSKHVQQYVDSNTDLFVLHCNAYEDFNHILLAKSTIENCMRVNNKKERLCVKNICMIFHLNRQNSGVRPLTQLNFLSGWKMVMIDSLEKSKVTLSKLITLTPLQVLESRPIIPHLKDILFWAFTRVQHTGLGHTAENVMELVSKVRNCDKILSVFARMVLSHLSVQVSEIGHCEWQRDVALNKHALCSASCFVFALEEYLLNLIRNPLCKIIFKLEELNALHCVFVNDNEKERFSMWKKMTLSETFLRIKDIPDQSGPECYTCTSPRLDLKLPYSFVILTNIEKIHSDFAHTMKRLQLTYELDDEVPTSILNGLITDYKDIIAQEVSEYTDMDYSQKENEYLNDFCLFISSSEKTCLTNTEKIRVLSWSLSLYGDNSSIDFVTLITQIHIINWTYRTAIVSILKAFSIVKEKIGVSSNEILEFLEQYPHCFNGEEDKISTTSEDIDFDRSFESRKKLVEVICTNLIPTTTVVSKFSTIYSWQNCICRLLPFLCTISMEPESLHVLRFSYDFASLIEPLSTEDSLKVLSALGDHFDRSQCVLGTKDTFQLVLSHVRLLKAKENVSKKGLDKLLCTFLSRCFAANPEDYNMMKMFLETVIEDSALNNSLDYLGPILSFVVRMAKNLEEGIFVELLDISSDSLHENPLIDTLDGCIVSLCNRNNGDLSLSSLLVDVLQEEIFSVNLIEEDIYSVQTGSDDVIATAFKAYKILKGFEGCSFKTVVAVAYLKSFMSAFANVILKQEMKTDCTILYSSVDALLQIRDAEKAFEQHRCQSVLLYFLKCLHEHRDIHQLEKLVQGLCEQLPALKSVPWNPEFPISMLLFNPVMQYELDTNTILLAIQELEQQKDSSMKQILQIATKDQNTMLSLCGVLANKFFLRLGLKEICDSEKNTAANVLRLVNQDFPNLQKQTIKLLTNSVDFVHPMFHINTEIKTPQTEIVSVLIHLLCLIGSKGSWGNLFFDVMVMPNETTTRYIPGRDSSIEIGEDIQPVLCDCKVRFASKTRTCPNCHEIAGRCNKEGDYQLTDDNNKSVCKMSYISSDRLSPTSSHMMEFFINGCLMLAYTCDFADKRSICRFIDTSKNEFGEDVLQRSLICEWNTIKNLLAVNDKDMCSLMHITINRLKNIFTSSTYPMSCQTDGERSDFEKEFNVRIEQIITERHRYILRTRRELYMKQNVNMVSMECHLEEVSIISGLNQRFQMLPDLFRMTMLPTKDNFQNFLFTGENCRNHPFLCMVMKHEDSLCMPRYIIPLLKWHQSTVSICRYKMKKVECKDKTIEMLLDMEKDDARRCVLKKNFEEFKDSWNDLLKKHNSTLTTHLKEYGNVSLKSKIIDCIITGNESAILKILNGLVNIQNDFLDKCLSLATSSSSVHCIDFLSCDEGCSQVHSTSLWDLKPRDIVSFLWNDKLLRYSQCNTYLGEGKERTYDFQKIEIEIAHDLILGKPYIDIGSSIPRVVFVDDLFQNTIHLLKHVRDTIPQENLTSEMVKNILKMKETKYAQISELLTLLGMVLSVLKKTKGDPCMSVMEYVEKWKIFVTTSSASCKCLPEPADSVKICHIVNLYYFLEEVNGASVLDSLESHCRQAIPSDGKLMLETVGQHSVKYLEVLGQAINVFIHRCLSSSENAIELEQVLFDYLDDEQFWPFGSFQNGCIVVSAGNQKPLKDVLCDSLCVKHIYETSQFIKDFIEEHNIKAQKASSIAASYLTKSQSTASKSTRKSRSFARKDLGKT